MPGLPPRAIFTYASHVAAMAPGTNIDAATPVDIEGGDLQDKIVKDATAYARALAELRGRDVEFAVDMVQDGRSAAAGEALDLGVVEIVAPTTRDLLNELDGRVVVVGDDREVTLQTAGAAVAEYDMPFFRRVQQWLADPNLAFLLLSLGTSACSSSWPAPASARARSSAACRCSSHSSRCRCCR